MQVLVKLQAFTGEDEQRGLTDVEDRITDPLQEFCDEEMRDDEARILSRPHEAAKALRERLPVLPVELGLAATRVLGLLRGRVGEGGDHLVQRGQRAPRWPGQREGAEEAFERRHVQGLQSDIEGVATELTEI